jgi:hypothetical protein
MRRGGRAGEIVDFVDRQIEWFHDIVAYEAESIEVQEMPYVLHSTRGKIVHANDRLPFLQKTLAKVRSKKAGTAGY